MKNNYLLRFYTFLILFTAYDCLYSQLNYGLKVGVNFDNIGDIKRTTSFKNQIETATIASAHLGMYAQLNIVDLYIRPEFQFSQNKSDILSLDQIEINKLEIPILIGYNVFGPISIFSGPIFQNIISKSTEFCTSCSLTSTSEIADSFDTRKFVTCGRTHKAKAYRARLTDSTP